MQLGPLYLPAYGGGIVNEMLHGNLDVFGRRNFMERGPYYPETHHLPPQPWP